MQFLFFLLFFQLTSASFLRLFGPENLSKSERPDTCIDSDIHDECLGTCRSQYYECFASCNNSLFCESHCRQNFAACEASCPCGVDCPLGCERCDHPLCDECKDAEISNDDYKMCVVFALDKQNDCVKKCPPNLDCMDQCYANFKINVQSCPCIRSEILSTTTPTKTTTTTATATSITTSRTTSTTKINYREFIKCYKCFHQLYENGMEVGSADCINPDENTKISEKLRYKTHTSTSTGRVWNLRMDCQAVKGTGYEEVILPNGEPGWNHFTFTKRGHFEYFERAPGYNYNGKKEGTLNTLELHSCGSDINECSKFVTFPILEPEQFYLAGPPTPSEPHGQNCYKCTGKSHFDETGGEWVESDDFKLCETPTQMLSGNITDCWGTCEVQRQSFMYNTVEMSREVKRFCNNGTENSNTQKNTKLNEFHREKADASIMCQSDLCNFDNLNGGFSNKSAKESPSVLIDLISLFLH